DRAITPRSAVGYHVLHEVAKSLWTRLEVECSVVREGGYAFAVHGVGQLQAQFVAPTRYVAMRASKYCFDIVTTMQYRQPSSFIAPTQPPVFALLYHVVAIAKYLQRSQRSKESEWIGRI